MNDTPSKSMEELVTNYATAVRQRGNMIEPYNALMSAIEATQARVRELETELLRANDAAAKGDLARANAGGMEMRIAELQADNERLRKEAGRLLRKRPRHLLDPRFSDWDAWLADVAQPGGGE